MTLIIQTVTGRVRSMMDKDFINDGSLHEIPKHRYGSICKWLFCLLMLFPPKLLIGQPSLHYIEKLTTSQGLSSNRVSDIVQDKEGFLWIGTSHGLNRYDGTRMIHYFADTSKNTLSNNIIYRLVTLDSTHLAIATHHGLSILNTRTETIHNIYFASDSLWEPYDNTITLLEKDRNGNLWAGTPTCLYRLDPHMHISKIFRGDYKPADIRKKRMRYVKKIIPLATGEVVFWLNKGQAIWKPPNLRSPEETDTLINIRRWHTPISHLLASQPSQYCFQVYGHFLINFKLKVDSLYVYDEFTGKVGSCYFPDYDADHVNWQQRFSTLGDNWVAFSLEMKGMTLLRIRNKDQHLSVHYYPKLIFPDYTFRKMLQDQEGNWWATTDFDGLLKISPEKQYFQKKDLIAKKGGNQLRFETASLYRNNHKLFIASYGDGLYEWDLNSDKLTQYRIGGRTGTAGQNTVWNVHIKRGDTLWIGTQIGLFWYNQRDHKYGRLKQFHPSALDSFAITTQFTDTKGLVWMGLGAGHGVCVYNPVNNTFRLYPKGPSAYPFRYPIAMAEDSMSNIWFLSDNVPDLVYWIRKSNKFKVISLPGLRVKTYKPTGAFYLDKKGIIWYGLESVGLVRYDPKSNKLMAFGRERGLNTDLLYSIIQDKSGKLWIATAQGISCFEPSKKHFVNFTTADGLPAEYCSTLNYNDRHPDVVYAGAAGKIIYFSPDRFKRVNKPVRVQLTRLLVNNKPVIISTGKKISLPYRSNDITFDITGINLTDGVGNRYEYRLGNNNWIDIGNQREIRFASLAPGQYHFYFRAARRDGGWSPLTDHLQLTIKPPFTRTIWFYLLILVFVGGAFYAWYRYRMMQMLKLDRMRSQISHDLHDDIGSRLTNISMMSLLLQRTIRKGQGDHLAPDLLERINEESRSASQSMREIVWNVNPDNDDLGNAFPRMLRYATDLLEIKDINVQASVPELSGIKLDIEERRDLFLIFKEVIHNVAKHANAKEVTIVVKLHGKMLKLQIADNGFGFNRQALPYRNGLDYMEERAKHHHWQLSVFSSPGKGTLVSIGIMLF